VETIKEARNRYGTDKVFGAVLAASTEAADNPAQLSYHHLAETSILDVGFDATKETIITEDTIVLGDSHN
jgi:hypothetical protein